MDCPYDVVLYGATGFVGQQTVQYFAEHAPAGLRWAIAGRNLKKLQEVQVRSGCDAAVLVVESQDQKAVDVMVASARVILNTAGPFSLYGDAMVDACVRLQTDYVDITGETPWVKSLCDRYHHQAAAEGTRIIPCCGFDSIPSDLGVYLLVDHLWQQRGQKCQLVKGYFQMFGGVNGGTLASAFQLYESGQAELMTDPFLLNPAGTTPDRALDPHQDPRMVQYDPDIATWVAPFVMATVNTRVVRRSCALFQQWQAQGYGEDFVYQEYLKFDPPFAQLKAIGVATGLGLFLGAFQQPQLRQFLQARLPQPGQGPTVQTMDSGWFRCELLGRTSEGQRIRGMIQDQGDPGNRVTVKCVCESALSLALDRDQLPGGSERGGILTPATGLGPVLADRLKAAGMQIEITGC
jgi:short subunit dehydrogenase-like uncharacterized protein